LPFPGRTPQVRTFARHGVDRDAQSVHKMRHSAALALWGGDMERDERT
jgi:hypothetical protein